MILSFSSPPPLPSLALPYKAKSVSVPTKVAPECFWLVLCDYVVLLHLPI